MPFGVCCGLLRRAKSSYRTRYRGGTVPRYIVVGVKYKFEVESSNTGDWQC